MAKAGRKPTGKVLLTCRVDGGNLKRLDEIAAAMPVPPSRSQMVDLAVAEFVKANTAKKSK